MDIINTLITMILNDNNINDTFKKGVQNGQRTIIKRT